MAAVSAGAVPGLKALQRIDISTAPSSINAISWSTDNRLAVATNNCVAIISITGLQNVDKKKSAKLKITRNVISSDTKYHDYDVGLEFGNFGGVAAPLFSVCPCLSTSTIDPALCPEIFKQVGSFDAVTCAKWSPAGCDKIGRSILAVLFQTSRLALFMVEKLSNRWREIADLSQIHYEQMKTQEYYEKQTDLKGEIPSDARTAIGERETWSSFHEWQRRKYLLNFTCMEWCPSLITCVDNIKKPTSSEYGILATTVKSGQLFIWQGKVPMMNSGSVIRRVLAAHTAMFFPCSLAWYSSTTGGATYLACGNATGLIKVFFIKISSKADGSPAIVFTKAYSFLDIKDDRSVDCLAWHAQGNKLFLACSKGPHISLFHSTVMKEGSLSAPAQQIVTGVHLLNVTALTISPSGTLLSTSADGIVQQFQIGSRERSRALECNTPAGFGCVGIAVSPNGVFLALMENTRKTVEKKRYSTALTYGQIVIIPLITEEENNKQLMSSTLKSTDIPRMWDRFRFQEMFTQKLSDSMIFPQTLEGFSESHLQFLRHVLASNPKGDGKGGAKKVEGEGTEKAVYVGAEASKNTSSDVDMTSSSLVKPFPSSSNNMEMVERIDEQIAKLTMQQGLMAFLKCHEEYELDRLIFAGDPTIQCICHWLAQRSDGDESAMELLQKAWCICKPSPVSADSGDDDEMEVNLTSSQDPASGSKETETLHSVGNICQEILESKNIFEKCMCGQPIPLQEIRFGRCVSGHVWPRCCVTFKLLEGTNCRVCENCNAHALILDPFKSPAYDWTRDLLKATSSCTYCGGWFGYVY